MVRRKSTELPRNGLEQRSGPILAKRNGHRPKRVAAPRVCIHASRSDGDANRNDYANRNCHRPGGRHDDLLRWPNKRTSQVREQLLPGALFS
jgi:hypothetical protein